MPTAPSPPPAPDHHGGTLAAPGRTSWWRDPTLLPSALAGTALAVGYLLDRSGLAFPAVAIQTVALAAGAWTFAPSALRSLARGRLGVGLLMTIAAAGAVALGHIEEAAALAFLFSLAEALEDRAMDRAQWRLHALLTLVPDSVRLSRPDGEVRVRTHEIRELDILVVGAGERIATDGVVVEGHSHLDTSAITGESSAVSAAPGDAVAAGSINGAGTLRIKATADGRDNSLTRIVALVEQAHTRKGQRARLADRISRPLVPLVLVTAALVAAFGAFIGEPELWLERALVVLVAASPCALAIAVPVTVISAIGAASTFGVVITSGRAFESFGTIRTVALDKTGTLTCNAPRVVAVETSPGWDSDRVLAVASALEADSTHPLAGALRDAAPDHRSAVEVVEKAGHGLSGRLDGIAVRIGSTHWIDAGSLSSAADAMAAAGMSVVAVEVGTEIAGIIGVRDELRPESAETIALLKRLGISTVMLTGDNARTARALAALAGIDEVRAGQLPAEKASAINDLVHLSPTAMVGDGINDAPALATATVGIAMGATGSAAAVEAADIAFTGHDLRLIPAALAHARRGRRIMTANIALALTVIVGLFPLALFGVLGLAGVILIHEAAEVLVILNGVRAAQRPRIGEAPHSGGTEDGGPPAGVCRSLPSRA